VSRDNETEALHRALLAAFPSQGALEQMLRFGMGWRLAEIASGNLSDQVFAILKFAEARGLVSRLVEAARAANPDNPALRAVATRAADAVARQPSESPVVQVDKRALRHAILEAYSLEELELLCADLEEQLNARGHGIRLSLEELGGSSKPAKVLNLIEFLDRRHLLNTLVETVRQQRPGQS
jgi:hypothetical protein